MPAQPASEGVEPGLTRRSFLAVGGATATFAAFGLGGPRPGESLAGLDAYTSPKPAAVPDWFDNAEVNLKWTIGGGTWPTGTVAGEQFQLTLTPSMIEPQGLKVYKFSGRFGPDDMYCKVDFGADGDSFRATGALGPKTLVLSCEPRPAGTKKWPVGGTIDGEPLDLVLDLTDKGPVLSGSLGPTRFYFGLVDAHYGPDAGETGGSKGRGTFTVAGTTRRYRQGPAAQVTLVYVLQGSYGAGPAVVTLTGRMTGPAIGLLVGLAFLYGAELQY